MACKRLEKQYLIFLCGKSADREKAATSLRIPGQPCAGKVMQIGLGQCRVGNDADPVIRERHFALDFSKHRCRDRHEAVEDATLYSQPPSIEWSDELRKVTPFQIVADLDENRRASITEEKLHRDANNGVGVAWTKDRVGLLLEKELEERPDHPDRLPPVGRERFCHDTIVEGGSGIGTGSAASAEDDDGIMPLVSPMFGKAQRDTLHPAWFEAVNGNGDPHAG